MLHPDCMHAAADPATALAVVLLFATALALVVGMALMDFALAVGDFIAWARRRLRGHVLLQRGRGR